LYIFGDPAMAIEPQLMVQCVGAVVVLFAARMCHAAFVASIDVWYSSPANRHVYFKAFKDKQLDPLESSHD
jgi:hypothetical protein